MGPSKVLIENERVALQANKPLELLCRAFESRPPANLRWLKSGIELVSEDEDGDEQKQHRQQLSSRSHLHAPKTKITQAQDKLNSSGSLDTNSKGDDQRDASASSLSRLLFVPRIEDSGQTISCVAENLALGSQSSIQDSWTLEVNFLPQLKLTLGDRIQGDQIREGTDVYLECTIRARPPANEVRWWFEGRELETNLTEGVFISNQSLVLQRVQRHRRGKYSCSASNQLGEAHSNELYLRVLFAPVCRNQHQSSNTQKSINNGEVGVFGAGRMEQVRVQCQVEADPMEPLSFRWAFVPAAEQEAVSKQKESSHNEQAPVDWQSWSPPSSSRQDTLPATSQDFLSSPAADLTSGGLATYTPRAELDYGSLVCWATNSVGSQREPCSYKIVPAERPEPVSACRLANASHSQLVVACKPGYNGGLSQTLRMEVYARDERILVANVSNHESSTNNNANLNNNDANGLAHPEAAKHDNSASDVPGDSRAKAPGESASLVLDRQQQSSTNRATNHNNFATKLKHKHSTGGRDESAAALTTSSQITQLASQSRSPSNETFLITEPNLEPATTYLVSVFATNPKGESPPLAFEASTSKLTPSQHHQQLRDSSQSTFRKGKCANE